MSTGSSSSALTGGSPYVKSGGSGQVASDVRCKDRSGSDAMLAFLVDCYMRIEQEERRVGPPWPVAFIAWWMLHRLQMVSPSRSAIYNECVHITHSSPFPTDTPKVVLGPGEWHTHTYCAHMHAPPIVTSVHTLFLPTVHHPTLTAYVHACITFYTYTALALTRTHHIAPHSTLCLYLHSLQRNVSAENKDHLLLFKRLCIAHSALVLLGHMDGEEEETQG